MRYATSPTPNRQGPASQEPAHFDPVYLETWRSGALAGKVARAREELRAPAGPAPGIAESTAWRGALRPVTREGMRR